MTNYKSLLKKSAAPILLELVPNVFHVVYKVVVIEKSGGNISLNLW